MNKFNVLLIASMISVTLAGCDSAETTNASDGGTKSTNVSNTSNEKEEFKEYLTQVRPIVQEMSVFAKDFDSLRQESADGVIDDATFGSRVSEESLPMSIQIQEKIEKIVPPKALRDTHGKMIGMMAKNTEAMTEIISAVDTGDASKITSANNLLTEARTTEREFIYDLQDLSEKHGVSLK